MTALHIDECYIRLCGLAFATALAARKATDLVALRLHLSNRAGSASCAVLCFVSWRGLDIALIRPSRWRGWGGACTCARASPPVVVAMAACCQSLHLSLSVSVAFSAAW